MKKIRNICLIIAGVFTLAGCEDYLDVNTNPNGPDALLQPELFLPQIQSELAVAIQWDGRFTGFYTQNWIHANGENYSLNLHSNPLSDFYATLWRAVYWSMGYNLSDMIESGELNEKYGFVGVGQILRAYGWQMLTDYHGPVIVTEAFDSEKRVFNYDDQQEVYAEIQRLLLAGIESLERTDGLSPAESGLTEADLIYNGDTEKWKKFAYGLLAINAHRLTNKSSYDPQEVIGYVDQAFTGNEDDASIRFEGTVSANTNFFGPLRGNIGFYRQSKFITGLLDGTNPELQDTELVGDDPVYDGEHLKDPRITAMLAPSPDGQYRGVNPIDGVNEWSAEEADLVPKNFWNQSGYVGSNPSPQIYFFNNSARFPLMTYAQLQFIKSEAAWIGNQETVALEAYTNGVNSHMDFARQYAPDQDLFDQRRAEYQGSEELIPASAEDLTLSKIMLQKYIATWGWGFFETWSDMRRYHYDKDVADADAVYKGFELPNPLYITNNEEPAYRARPRFNSEYMWNQEALEELGAFEDDYHTYETWFSKPE